MSAGMTRTSQAEFLRWFSPLLDALRDLGDSGRPREVSSRIAHNLQLPNLQKGPKAIGQLQDLLSGAHCFGPRRSLAPLATQLHHPLQSGLKGLADRSAALLQRGPVDRSALL